MELNWKHWPWTKAVDTSVSIPENNDPHSLRNSVIGNRDGNLGTKINNVTDLEDYQVSI